MIRPKKSLSLNSTIILCVCVLVCTFSFFAFCLFPCQMAWQKHLPFFASRTPCQLSCFESILCVDLNTQLLHCVSTHTQWSLFKVLY